MITAMPYFPMQSEKDRVRKGFVSEEELVGSLIPKLPSHLKPLVVCAFHCGGRTGEWLRLNWSDVDFEHGVIYFVDSKNGEAREVPIFKGLMRDTLLQHKSVRDVIWPELDAVFTFDGVSRLRIFKRSWKTAMRKAGFPHLTPHDLRRSASRWMRNKGITRDVRKTIMGHKTNSMDDRYSIVDKADLDEAKRLGSES
jgi:integrase